MPQITKSKKLPYTAEQMFDLVADVDKYKDFLPWCGDSKIISKTPNEIVGELTLVKGAFRKSFVTRNLYEYPNRMDIAMIKGPFKTLNGHWEFKRLNDGCEVSCQMKYDIPLLLQPVIGTVVEHMATTMVEAFATRAMHIYFAPQLR